MKTLKIFGMALTAMMFAACSGSENEPQTEPVPNQEGKEYEVSLKIAEEGVTITEEPMSRTDNPKKYYGVNVYWMKADGSETSYSRYAYGLFDDEADMKILLLGGYKYKFECTSAEEGEDGFYEYNSKSALSNPFQLSTSSYFYKKNMHKFIIDSSINLSGIGKGETCCDDGGYYHSYPKMDRFYGELEGYEPTANGTATIPMKRTSFGIKVVINGVPDGSLAWEMSSDLRSSGTHSGSTKKETSTIYTFSKVYESWASEKVWSEDFSIYFTWTRGNSIQQTFSKSFTVKRNVMTILDVTLKGGSDDTPLGLKQIDTNLTDETVTIEYNGGELSDTQVDPDEQN